MPKTNNFLNGFKAFRERYYGENGLMQELFEKGQRPGYLIIHCMDSRSNPADLLQTDPGTFFDHAPMGAIVPPHEAYNKELKAKLEYAIEYAGSVKNIIIMGHTRCGAIAALCSGMEDKNITPWLNVAQKAFDQAKTNVGDTNSDVLMRETEKQVVKFSVENLLEYPVVKKAVAEGRLNVEGWLFKMRKGNLMELNQKTGEFEFITNFDEENDYEEEDSATGAGCGCSSDGCR